MADEWMRAAERFRKPIPRWVSPLDLAVAIDPTYRRTPALELLAAALVDVAHGRCRRLAISMPPQEGKSSLLGVFLLWLLTFRPDTRNAMVSYELDTAAKTGRKVRDWIGQYDGSDGTLDLELRVRRDENAAARWSLAGRDGGLISVGVGGALTGRSVTGVLVVDDALKGHEEAMSAETREKTWNWWQTTALTRLGPGAAAIVCGTRWHHEDLIGKVIADAPKDWRVINIPAMADSPDDPLDRAEGEPMVSARGRTREEWDSIHRAVGTYTWNALYQGRPAPIGGGMFQTDKLQVWTRGTGPGGQLMLTLADRSFSMEMCWRFLVADLAASVRTSADFTVIAAVAITPDRDLVVLDLVRDRMTPDKHFDAVRPMFKRWSAHTLYVESMMHTTALVRDASVAGIPILPLQPDKDKITRALPAAARMEQGKVWVPAGAEWVQVFTTELAAFPVGAHDDIADVLSYAARLDTDHYLPPMTYEESAAERYARWLDEEFDRRMDNLYGPPVDLMRDELW